MKRDCDTCGYGHVDDDFMAVMGCFHTNWKNLRSKYTEETDDAGVDCWFPEGCLDVVREQEEL